MKINEFLRNYRMQCNGIQVVRPRVKCADGYTVSVQAGEYHYCSPRADVDHFDKVELGYPSDEDSELMDYAEEEERPCELVDGVLAKHGGIVDADFSNDMAGFWGEHSDDKMMTVINVK